MEKKLGIMIDYYRRQNNLTLEELGKKLGKSPSAVSRWITGDRSPMVEDLIRLTDLFDTDITTLMYGRQKKPAGSYWLLNQSISAGLPMQIDAVKREDLLEVEISDVVMGKYAGHGRELLLLKVNGESMNRVIPHGSLVAIMPVEIHQLRKNDIVVFSDGGEFGMKRFLNDETSGRFIFRPDSTEDTFSDYVVPYDRASEVHLLGKVVVSVIQYD